jgi:hypothetical protein
MLRIISAERLEALNAVQAERELGVPLALYGKREGDAWDLAAIFHFARDRQPFWVIGARISGDDFIGSFEGLEAARTAATRFVDSEAEIDWLLQGSAVGWIQDCALALSAPDDRASVREEWASAIAEMPDEYGDPGVASTAWLRRG